MSWSTVIDRSRCFPGKLDCRGQRKHPWLQVHQGSTSGAEARVGRWAAKESIHRKFRPVGLTACNLFKALCTQIDRNKCAAHVMKDVFCGFHTQSIIELKHSCMQSRCFEKYIVTKPLMDETSLRVCRGVMITPYCVNPLILPHVDFQVKSEWEQCGRRRLRSKRDASLD